MEEIRYNFFERIMHSIKTGNFYLDIRKEELSRAIKYFLLLAFILTTASFIQFAVSTNSQLKETTTFIKTNIPDFTLEKGLLTVDAPMPITQDNGDSIYIVDTTGKTPENVLDNHDLGMLITSDKVIYKKNAVETRVIKFSEFNDLILQKSDVLGLIDKWASGVILLLVILGILFSIAGKLIGLLFVSLLGMIVNAIGKAKLTYSAIFKTCAYVMTLPLILKTVLELANINIPFFFIIYYVLITFYLFKTLRLSSDEAVIEIEELLN